jgi:F-type H+-transporting ATPase subunit gamma
MPATLRAYEQRIRSTKATQKITKAMELIAASRIAKARDRVTSSRPYSRELTRALTALASNATIDHPLLQERPEPRRAAVLIITSDRGLAGAYSAGVIKAAGELQALLREEGKEPKLYVIGRKGIGYYRFRRRELAGHWDGFSERPAFTDAREVGETLLRAFTAGADDTAEGPGGDEIEGVDEVHVVYTEFQNMVVQQPTAVRIAPMVVEETEEPAPEGMLPQYEFEPEPEELLAALLPKYLNARIYSALLDAAASESAARQRAMKSASDNASELIETLTREKNQARQAQITQEISEIVGGADALAAS